MQSQRAMGETLDCCNTSRDLLHRLVAEGLGPLQAAVESGDRSLPRFVIEELRRYTTCGDPRGGFGWLVCDTCRHHRLVPFSCKGRGFCPSCGGRRMAARAARWVDHLLPRVAVRQVLGGRPYRLPPRCASCDGYSLHAGVAIGARDRKGLERLCRYIARPPLAKSRLETREDGTVVIRLKQPWADGTGAIQLSRLELMERLAALVPPPRKNQVLYHGVLAPRAAWREEIVPKRKLRSDHEHAQAIIRPGCASRRSRWMLWSTLLKRVFEVDGFECPTCDQPMRLQAVVLPPATLRVLDGLERACRGPPQQGAA